MTGLGEADLVFLQLTASVTVLLRERERRVATGTDAALSVLGGRPSALGR